MPQLFRALVYGPAGGGKSWFAKSAVDWAGGSAVIFDTGAEDGWRVLGLPYASAKDIAAKDIIGKVIQTGPQVPVGPILEYLVREAQLGRPKAKLVIVDGLSEQEIVRVRGITQTIADKRNKDVSDVEGKQVWGAVLEEMLSTMFYLQPSVLQANVLCTARMRLVVDPIDGGELWWPSVRGAFGDNLPHYFDLISLYRTVTEKTGTERRMYLRQRGRFLVKNRWEHRKEVPDYLVTPTFADLVKVLAQPES